MLAIRHNKILQKNNDLFLIIIEIEILLIYLPKIFSFCKTETLKSQLYTKKTLWDTTRLTV